MRPYFADYAVHCLKLRLKNPEPPSDPLDLKNWTSADAVVKNLTTKETDILRKVYSYHNCGFQEQIEYCAGKYESTVDEVWDLIRNVQYEIAVQRGLVL